MATPLDLGLLKEFGVIFPFLLIFIITYAILLKTKYFENNKGLASLLGLVLAVMVLFSPIARDTINTMAPWFVLLFIFILFTLMAFMIFGTTESDIMNVLKGERYGYINMWVIALVLIITLGSLTSVISERGGIGKTPTKVVIGENGEEVVVSEQTSEFWQTLVNPKVLGMVLILMIASFTIRFMTQ